VLLALVDALADGVVLAYSDGVIALANRRAEDMFGYSHCRPASAVADVLALAPRKRFAGHSKIPSSMAHLDTLAGRTAPLLTGVLVRDRGPGLPRSQPVAAARSTMGRVFPAVPNVLCHSGLRPLTCPGRPV